MKERNEPLFWIYTGVNILVILIWTTFILHQRGLSVVLWVVSFFFGIPIFALVLRGIRRKSKNQFSIGIKAYFTVSKIFLGLSWLFVGINVLFYSYVILHSAQPWPLSLRQGPDTYHAHEIFEKKFRFNPPLSVNELFGKKEWAGHGEHIDYIKFRFSDKIVVHEIVKNLSLEQVAVREIKAMRSFSGPQWWPPKEVLASVKEAYRSKWGDNSQKYVHFWIDNSNGIAYFQDVKIY